MGLVIPEQHNIYMKPGLFLIATWVAMMFISGCKSTKQISQLTSSRDSTVWVKPETDSVHLIAGIVEKVDSSKISFQTFSAKIRVDAEDNNVKQPDLSATVRMIKDSAIWISLSATFLNIEVYRVLITSGEVILMNKQDKEVQYRTLSYLQDVTGIPFDFNTLQDMLIGNPIFINDSPVFLSKKDNLLNITFTNEYYKHLLTIDNTTNRLLHSKLDDMDVYRNRSASITYSDYEDIGGQLFSTGRQITITEKKKLNLKLKYKQVEFNKELSVVMKVPKNYKRK